MEGKYDLFTKVSDRRDISDFVKEVEKYRCLYDKTLPEYANKVHNRRAWSEIAKRANTTVPDCRDKWRKIRISFMRSLKQLQSDKPPMRPYYLTQDLHFLLPFIKVNPKTQSENKETQSKDDGMDFEISTMVKHDISDSESSGSIENEINENDKAGRLTFNDNAPPNIMKGRIENGQTRHNGVRNSYSEDIEGNPRKMFLLSMLPDIESLTEPEMRIFRREVIKLVDCIINKRGSSSI